MQDTDSRWLWTRKNKCIVEFKKPPTRYLSDLSVFKGSKYQLLIDKWQDVGLKHFKDAKALIEYSNDMKDIYKKIQEWNPGKEKKKKSNDSVWWFDNWKLMWLVSRNFIQ